VDRAQVLPDPATLQTVGGGDQNGTFSSGGSAWLGSRRTVKSFCSARARFRLPIIMDGAPPHAIRRAVRFDEG
jgi:hypothetical protein